MPKVYIPNDSGQDFSAAEEWGELVRLTVGTQNRWNLRGHYHSFFNDLADSKPEDYLIMAGMPSQIAVASGILARKHGVVNFLMFDAKSLNYREYKIKFADGEVTVPETI